MESEKSSGSPETVFSWLAVNDVSCRFSESAGLCGTVSAAKMGWKRASANRRIRGVLSIFSTAKAAAGKLKKREGWLLAAFSAGVFSPVAFP